MKKILYLFAVVFLYACTKGTLNSPASLNVSGLINRLPTSPGTTYYVDSTSLGMDTNNGTDPSTPWKTLAKVAATTFNPGDRILFKSGHSWSGTLRPKGSGTSTAPIIIDKYGTGNKPIIRGPGTDTSAGVSIKNQSYWGINNIEVTNYHTGNGKGLCGILVKNTDTTTSMNHIYIHSCYVHDVNAYPDNISGNTKSSGGIIFTGYFDEVDVRNCYIKDCTIEGLRTIPNCSKRSTRITFVSNKLENIYGDGIVLNTVDHALADSNLIINPCMSLTGGYAGCWTYNSHYSIVSHNEVYGIVGGKGDGEAFDADQYTLGDIYEYNYSHDNAGGFTLVTDLAQNNIFRYNVSVNDGSGPGGPALSKLINYEPPTSVTTFYNNVFYISANLDQLIRNNYSPSTGFKGAFYNNIIRCTGTIGKFDKAPVSSSAAFQNNCFYPASITAINGPGTAGTFSGNINSDPSFIAPGSHSNGLTGALDYRLNSNSPCLNTGTLIPLNGGGDYRGLPVYTNYNPDMGAFQHTVLTGAFSASDDAYVRDGAYANNNYGTSDSLWVKSDATSYNRKAYLKFGYSAVNHPIVQKATLTVYAFRVNTDPSRTISVYTTATDTWLEGTLKWNNAPMDTTYVDKITVTGVRAYTLDVTKAINAHPNKNVSFLLINKAAASPSNDVQFYSRQATSNQPQLSITY